MLSIKQLIEKQTGVPSSLQLLSVNGKILNDNSSSFEECDIESESTLQLRLRIVGGSSEKFDVTIPSGSHAGFSIERNEHGMYAVSWSMTTDFLAGDILLKVNGLDLGVFDPPLVEQLISQTSNNRIVTVSRQVNYPTVVGTKIPAPPEASGELPVCTLTNQSISITITLSENQAQANNDQAARELSVCAQTNESISIKAVPDQTLPPVPTLALNNDQAAGELAVCSIMLL